MTSVPCDYYRESGEDCLIDRSRDYSKCVSCTRAGYTYKREFYIGREQDLLRRAKDKLSSNIKRNKDKLDLLEPELSELQAYLAELH